MGNSLGQNLQVSRLSKSGLKELESSRHGGTSRGPVVLGPGPPLLPGYGLLNMCSSVPLAGPAPDFLLGPQKFSQRRESF